MKTLILIFVLLVTTSLYSTIINVPGDQPTVQDGIEAAADTDTVLVADGTYFENIDFIGKPITVASNFLIDGDTLHIENTIINGSQPTNPDFGSCAVFLSGEGINSVLTGFTLTEGTGTYDTNFGIFGGGGICIDDSSPTICNNIITQNSAEYTGGVSCLYNSNPEIIDNVISYNVATTHCGGLEFYQNSNAYVEGNIISNNSAQEGIGGVIIQTSSPIFVNNIICYNTADHIGGLDVLDSPGTERMTIENCHIYGNTCDSNRGGLQAWNANLDVINCTIYDNHAGSSAGGVGVLEDSDVTISYTSIYGNTASNHSGGIQIYNSELTVTNCTIYGNESVTGGSQIGCLGELEAVNSIVGGSTTNASVYFATSTATFDYCDFYNNIGPYFDANVPTGLGDIVDVNANGDSCDIFMNIFLDPLFVDLANNEFHLTEFSPCIDAGDPDSPLDPDGTIADIGRFYFDQSGIEENTIVQTEDYLQQNYPNPFNPETKISYQLPENGEVELTVYNLKGQKVKTLVNETLESGNHTVIWKGTNDNGKSVSSGIYFYKMKTVTHEETKKMILMK